jgi:murein DD-endopeptidase MepM/ murein hydrolase activator NlpD
MKTVAIFALGFVAGILCLAAALWNTGNLMTVYAMAAPKAPAAVRFMAPAPGPPAILLPDAPPVPAAAVALPMPAVVDGSASASLGMPVAGVDPRKLHSNFAEMRGDHAHEALDIMAPRGTEVRAVAGGTVIKLFTSKPGGLTAYQFDIARQWCYYYAHLDRYAPGLKEGALLHQGDVLGYVGSTGDASAEAPHLHFAVFLLGPEKRWWQGTAVDPLPLLR